jgi:DNA-binding transcriptional LysR family regulator
LRITLRQIEAFYWSARLGSIHAAADHLNFSQPAVSTRIKELESALNVELFTRKNQRVQLTADGRNAVAYAERVLSAAQDFGRLGRAGEPLEGVLRLGSDESTAMVALSEILSQLKRRHPKLVVELTIDVGAALREKLRRREIDMALHTNAEAAPHVIDEQLGWVDFQWVAARDLDVPEGDFVPAVASKLPIVTNSPPSTLNSAVQKWLRSGGFEFDGVNLCNSLSLMLRLVRDGHAIAVLPVAILREQLATGELRCLPAIPPIPPAAYYASTVKSDAGRGTAIVVEIAKSVLAAERFFTRTADASAAAHAAPP